MAEDKRYLVVAIRKPGFFSGFQCSGPEIIARDLKTGEELSLDGCTCRSREDVRREVEQAFAELYHGREQRREVQACEGKCF